jgi:DNA-binding beta-propeller fold protein YncE
MKLKKFARAMLAVCGIGVLGFACSCGANTLGYLFTTSQMFNQIYSVHINPHNGALKFARNFPKKTSNSPVGSGGSLPTYEALSSNLQWLYVLNAGSGTINGFSIGSSGNLYTQALTFVGAGVNPVYITTDASGSFLYEVEQYQKSCAADSDAATTCPGEISAFTIDTQSGQLIPIENTAAGTYFFPLGIGPVQANASAAGYLYAVDSGDRNVYNFAIQPSGSLTAGSPAYTNVNANGAPNALVASSAGFLYVTDPVTDVVYTFVLSGTGVPMLPSNTNALAGSGPDAIVIDPQGIFVYVADYTSNQIEAFSIPSTCAGAGSCSLTGVSGSPFPAGAGPRCIAMTVGPEFIYTANYNDGTVSGAQVNIGTGQLSVIGLRNYKITTAGQAACLIYSSKH